MKYDLQDWLDDYTWYCVLTDGLQKRGEPKGSQDAPFLKYFAEKYRDGPSVTFHRERMAAALSYFERHVREIDLRPLAVVGEDRALVTKAFVVALFRIYAQCPDDELETDFPVGLVIEFAKENQAIMDRQAASLTEDGDSPTLPA